MLPEQQHMRDIAKARGYYVEDESTGLGKQSGSIGPTSVQVAMKTMSPMFDTSATQGETPFDALAQGDTVDVYKRGTNERQFRGAKVHAVNVIAQELHVQSEQGLRSINVNDYLVVKVAGSPDAMPGNLKPSGYAF